MDVLAPDQRRLNMSRIRGKDTKPELIIRRGLHALGYRYRLHVKDLPGKPDLVFPRYRTVIFVHGCFWHGHDCPSFKLPATRQAFWRAKIGTNQKRDAQVLSRLQAEGWRCLVIWECSLKGPGRRPLAEVCQACVSFLKKEPKAAEIVGNWSAARPG